MAKHYKFPLGTPYNWNRELGPQIKAERQLKRDEREVTFATYCVTRPIYNTLAALLLPKVTFGCLNKQKTNEKVVKH